MSDDVSPPNNPDNAPGDPADVEIIPAEIDLKLKVGGMPGRKGAINEEAIQRAEKAIERVSVNYLEVGRAQVASLIGQFAGVKANPSDAGSAIMQVSMTAREIKGQAKTCGYNLLTDVAESMYRFLSDRSSLTPKQIAFVDAHLGVMQNVVAHDLRGSGGPVGTELLRSIAVAKQKLDDS
ncbi:MAG: hypothetical protein AAF213_09040 [Pseudomonadota bacterium]